MVFGCFSLELLILVVELLGLGGCDACMMPSYWLSFDFLSLRSHAICVRNRRKTNNKNMIGINCIRDLPYISQEAMAKII